MYDIVRTKKFYYVIKLVKFTKLVYEMLYNPKILGKADKIYKFTNRTRFVLSKIKMY